MANKTFNTRVKNKRDTAANWEAVATTFQPLDGELIIVDTAAGKTRFKVGRYDTAKGRLLYYNEIPFADEYLYNDLNESQGKIYDKLKGIDDKSIIEMTLEPSEGNGTIWVYHIGLWQFPKTGLYKIHLTQHGTTSDLFKVFARKTKDDGTLPEDFTQDNLVIQHLAMGDTQVNDLYIQVDYIDNDKLTVYNVRFLTLLQPYNAQVNVYDKTTQKWQFVSATYVQSAKSADRLAHQLTLTKGDTTTKFDGSTAQTVSIPTKTSELTNDSFVSYAEQTLTEGQQNQAKTNLGIDVLTGNKTTVKPTQVKEAILAGRPIAITYTDTTYGNLTFTSFGYSLENNVVVANLVATSNGQYILADLTGIADTNGGWTLQTTELGTSTDIANNYVKYSESQTLTNEQKAQARTNIDAISSSELVQSDWNQNDTIAKDYIKNRICYEEETVTELGNTYAVWNELTTADRYTPISYKMNGTIYKDVVPTYSSTAGVYMYNGVAPYDHYIGVSTQNSSIDSGGVNFQFVKVENTVKQIDPKFIPTVSPDWNQNDETAKDYIKNRICYEETGEDKTYTLTPNRNNNTWNFTNGDIPLILGQSATVKSFGGNSSTFVGTVTQDSDGKLCIDAMSVIPITIYSSTATYNSSWISNAGIDYVTVTISSTVVHQIDPKYIPDINKQTLTNGNITLTCDANIAHDNQVFQIINVNNKESKLALNENSIVLFTGPNSTGPGSSDIIFDNGEISNVYTKVLQDGRYSLTDTSFNINAHSDLNIISDSNTNIQAGINKVITIGDLASTSNEVNLLASNINIKGSKLAINSGTTNDVTATLNGKEIATKEYVDDNKTTITVDDALSDTSTNPVQNKVVKAAIDSKPSAADAVYTATAASTDGVAYTATVSGIDSLAVGASFIMIPNKASTSKAPTLNVNGLGAKPIRRRLSSLTTSLQQGYSTNWIALNKPFTVVYDGTAWVIEGLTKTDGADVYGAVAQATADAKGNNIADTYATIAMLQSLLPKVTTITLTSNWVGDASPYYQDIALSCVTETSIVDLQPTPEQLNSWQDDGIAFTTLSGNGTVRVYVAGGKPSSAISVQVRVQEVTVI